MELSELTHLLVVVVLSFEMATVDSFVDLAVFPPGHGCGGF
jgi:hypothetical protein